MRWKKLWWVELAFPCCARNGTCLIAESCSSNSVAKSPRLAAHSPWPHQNQWTSLHLHLVADQGHKHRPWKVSRTWNKLCPKGSGPAPVLRVRTNCFGRDSLHSCSQVSQVFDSLISHLYKEKVILPSAEHCEDDCSGFWKRLWCTARIMSSDT